MCELKAMVSEKSLLDEIEVCLCGLQNYSVTQAISLIQTQSDTDASEYKSELFVRLVFVHRCIVLTAESCRALSKGAS